MSQAQLMHQMGVDEWERRVGLLLTMVGDGWTERATTRFMELCIHDKATLDERGHVVLLDADMALSFFTTAAPPS